MRLCAAGHQLCGKPPEQLPLRGVMGYAPTTLRSICFLISFCAPSDLVACSAEQSSPTPQSATWWGVTPDMGHPSRHLLPTHFHFASGACISLLKYLRCRFIGVDHVYMTENDPSAPSASLRRQLADFVAAGFLTVDSLRAPHAQPAAMRACMERARGVYDWLAFLDADEFLFVRDECATL
jgi:Glycosyl transferase family 2